MSERGIKAVTKNSYGHLTYFDSVSPARIGECVRVIFDESKKNRIVPIINQQVLQLTIKKLKEDNDLSAEFISFAGANETFFSYSLSDLDDWDDSLCVLGTVGLVLDPTQSIEIMLPYLHGMKGVYRGNKRSVSFEDVDCY
jgi:hypothetical protein